jgi:hypothetical protein
VSTTGVSIKTLEIPEQVAGRPLTPPNAPPTTKQPSSYRLVIQNGNVVDVVKVRKRERERERGRGNNAFFIFTIYMYMYM